MIVAMAIDEWLMQLWWLIKNFALDILMFFIEVFCRFIIWCFFMLVSCVSWILNLVQSVFIGQEANFPVVENTELLSDALVNANYFFPLGETLLLIAAFMQYVLIVSIVKKIHETITNLL